MSAWSRCCSSPEPEHASREPRLRASLRSAVVEPFREFASRPRWLLILVFVVLYRLGDALAGGMSNPFYVQLGFTKLEIASVAKIFGVDRDHGRHRRGRRARATGSGSRARSSPRA